MASKPPFMMKAAAKKTVFKPCSGCPAPAKCKAKGMCMKKGK